MPGFSGFFKNHPFTRVVRFDAFSSIVPENEIDSDIRAYRSSTGSPLPARMSNHTAPSLKTEPRFLDYSARTANPLDIQSHISARDGPAFGSP